MWNNLPASDGDSSASWQLAIQHILLRAGIIFLIMAIWTEWEREREKKKRKLLSPKIILRNIFSQNYKKIQYPQVHTLVKQ